MTKSPNPNPAHYDIAIIGTGPGGAMAAHALVQAGARVVLLERGEWVRRGPENWDSGFIFHRSPYFKKDPGYRIRGEQRGTVGALHCVGGQSVFFGGVTLRFRAEDFHMVPEIHGPGAARWPFGYSDLEPHYDEAERLLEVAGEDGDDPTAPLRQGPYPQALPDLTHTSRRIWEAARRLDLKPFKLPLAINFNGGDGREPCLLTGTCDAHACAIGAKNDAATAILAPLVDTGMELRTGRMVAGFEHSGGRIRSVEAVEVASGRRESVTADRFVLAAGALGSSHLVLASGLEARCPAGDAVGRFLMRHCNAIVLGLFSEVLPGASNGDFPHGEFRKQVGVHDFYFGCDGVAIPGQKLGNVQQIQGAPLGVLEGYLPGPLKALGPWIADRTAGMIVIAEDQPLASNRVTINRSKRDRFGLPELRIYHRYSGRDRYARRALVRESKRILKEAGARMTLTKAIKTFSHALGTLRMGEDPDTSPVDEKGRFRGIDNLYIADGSVFPTSGGVNPSLTIAANALRVASGLLE